MASIDTLAVILGEATDVYLQSKSLDYAQAQFMQKQANIEIDRQLATERYNNALQADVYKSQIQRLGRRSDALQQSIIQSQAKYQGLTGELFKLTPESKTSSSREVLGDMENGGLTALSNELRRNQEETTRLATDLSTLMSQNTAIDLMRADMLRGGGGPAVAGEGFDPDIYEKQDFSYEEYLGRTGTTGTDWLKSGYRDIGPTELMKLNTDAIAYDYKKATTALYQAKGKLDAGEMYKQVDKALKAHWAQIMQSSTGFKTLADAKTVTASYSGEDRPEDTPLYRQYNNLVIEERLNIASKADPIGYAKIMQGYEMGSWGQDAFGERIVFSIDDYVNYASSTGDADFKDKLKEGIAEKDSRIIDFVKRAEMLDTWTKGVFKTHHSAIEAMKGLTNIQGTGKPLLELIDERKAQYTELIREGKQELAAKMDHEFFQVTGINLSNDNSIETFRNVVMNQGSKALKDKSLNTIVAKKAPGDRFKGSQDEVLYRDLWMEANKASNLSDLELQQDLNDMTELLFNKYGDTELSAGTAGW